MSTADAQAESSTGSHRTEISIHIDKQLFKVAASELTGEQLRGLPTPVIGPDRDLYEEVPAGEDTLVLDDQPVALRPGMHFFTTPHSITPGR